MFLASYNLPSIKIFILGNLGIGLTSAAGAAFNHIIDRKIDEKMLRTKNRPIPKYDITVPSALLFAYIMATIGFVILYFFINPTAAFWSLAALFGYSVIYTAILKHMTSQNIVIGGLSGALPPLLGWVCVNPVADAKAWLLVLIIYVWTPPHFWALAIAKIDDYKESGLPMLPITHGVEYTKINITLYSILLLLATSLPYAINMFSLLYLVTSFILNFRFIQLCIKLKKCKQPSSAMKVFLFSIKYLMLLFLVMLIDHIFIMN
jgi:protoheme IX farnesyltransferase